MGLFTLDSLRQQNAMERDDRRFVRAVAAASMDIASQQQFSAVLTLERKRSDRSDKPFLLMLLDLTAALDQDFSGSLVRRLRLCLTSSIRDTDSLGWHRNAEVLGVIFTEAAFDGPEPVSEVIQARMTTALANQLSPEELAQIRVTLHTYPDHWDIQDEPPANFDLYPDLMEKQSRRKVEQFVKRSIDVVGSASALLVFSPILAVIAALIRLTSKGPTFFRQVRVGRYGRRFAFYKFRTMVPTADPGIHKKYVQKFIAEADGSSHKTEGVIFKIKDDPRITSVGKILRKISLDELPQFWNVLKGDMSLVGPRPPIPYEVECYDTWHRRRLLEVKPGITGLWQVFGRSRTRFNDMVRLDLQYARSWSLWLDLKILIRTPGAVISGDGAY